MAIVTARLRKTLVLLVSTATCLTLVACLPTRPTVQPGPSAETSATPTDAPTDRPVEYTGPEVEPKTGAGPQLHSPEMGSAERKAVLNALRGPVEEDVGQPVIFKVQAIRVYGEWAYVRAQPLKPGGDIIDYSKTSFAEQVASGAFDDAVDGLVKNTDGTWHTVAHVIGASDVAWSPWPEEYGAPEAIFATP